MSDIKLSDIKYNKSVALMQPTFMPWIGYFGLILDADEFVFLDDFQFVRRSFHHRNKIFVSKDKFDFISVPVEHVGNQEVKLNEAKRQADLKWNKKFLKILKYNYSTSSYFQKYYNFIEEWLAIEFDSLADFNIHFIEFILQDLEIKTQIYRSSVCGLKGSRSQRLIQILEARQADLYLSARGSFDYMIEDGLFEKQDILYIFQDFQPKLYNQMNSNNFISHLSVLDCLLEHGPVATRENIEAGRGVYSSEEYLREAKNG